jgi:heat shock protein HslJ
MTSAGRRRRSGPVLVAGLALVVAWAAVGCGDQADTGLPGTGGSGDAGGTASGAGDEVTPLAGTSWVLAAVVDEDGSDQPAVLAPTLDFGPGGRLSGSTGCNSFSGTYRQEGTALRLDPGAMTKRACADETVQGQEDALLARLPRVRSFSRTSDELTLLDGGGAATLRYSAGLAGLAGSDWVVTAVNNGRGGLESSALTEGLTLSFAEDGTVSGTDGCNRYHGPYTEDGEELTIGTLGATMMACEPDVMALADQFQAALAATTTFSISGDTLTMRDADGAAQVTATIAD